MYGKDNIDRQCIMLYILYFIYWIYPINILVNSGFISDEIVLFNIISNIDIGYVISFYAFQIMFLMMSYLGIKSEERKIQEYKDEDRAKKIKDKTLPYKIFVWANVVVMIIIILITKENVLITPALLIIAGSAMIYYAKVVYYKSYLFNRKLAYLEKISGVDLDEIGVDTKAWRYKIWYSTKEKVKISSRKGSIIRSLLASIVFGSIVFIGWGLFTLLLFGFTALRNILQLLENIFSLFTSIDGICTSIDEQTGRNNSYSYYTIVITDYYNKREIRVKTKNYPNISINDKALVVHGVLSKQLVSINGIKQSEYGNWETVSSLILLLTFVIPNIMYIISGDDYSEDSTQRSGYNGYVTPFDNYNDYTGSNNNYDTQENTEYEFDSDGKEQIDPYSEKGQLYDNDKYHQSFIESLSLEDLGEYRTIDISRKEVLDNITIDIDKLHLGENASKLYFTIENNNIGGMVMNLDYSTKITSRLGNGSNILVPDRKYYLEMDILKEYKEDNHNNILIDLEYTLSETILNEFLDYNYEYYYPLNVIDRDILINIDINTEDVDIKFTEYDEYYNKSVPDDIVKFE